MVLKKEPQVVFGDLNYAIQLTKENGRDRITSLYATHSTNTEIYCNKSKVLAFMSFSCFVDRTLILRSR